MNIQMSGFFCNILYQYQSKISQLYSHWSNPKSKCSWVAIYCPDNLEEESYHLKLTRILVLEPLNFVSLSYPMSVGSRPFPHALAFWHLSLVPLYLFVLHFPLPSGSHFLSTLSPFPPLPLYSLSLFHFALSLVLCPCTLSLVSCPMTPYPSSFLLPFPFSISPFSGTHIL